MAGIAAICLGERLADDLRDQLARGCEQRLAVRIRMLVTSGDSRAYPILIAGLYRKQALALHRRGHT
jgi:hypothetical protein